MAQTTPAATTGKFVVVAEFRSAPSAPFESAIAAMGMAYRLSNNVWLLRAAMTVGAIRNNLTPLLGPRDSLFAADLATGRTAWLNLGPEADARIRAIVQNEPKA
jgi:hypothetical protein